MKKKYLSRSGRTHLKPEERVSICGFLNLQLSISEIARKLHRNKSSIAREIKRHSIIKEGTVNRHCSLLKRHKRIVCNGCPSRKSCLFDKIYYECNEANRKASEKKHSANAGPRISAKDFQIIGDLLARQTKKYQSIEVICEQNKDIIKVSPSTLRRWINAECFPTKRMNLPCARKYKKAYKFGRKGKEVFLNCQAKAGRTMIEYKAFVESHPKNHCVVQLDSVIGKTEGDKYRLLTMLVVDCTFQIGRLYNTGGNCADQVNEFVSEFVSVMLEGLPDDFVLVLLSDNGTEFDRLHLLEEKFPDRVKVFFTRPYCSTDKAECERNHEYFRKIIMKGRSFNDLTQELIDLIFSHINSYIRKSLNKRSPCELFAKAFGSDKMEKLGIQPIQASEVDLSPVE